ncbi:hypothetical protein [Salmonella enterica]|uniref:hypothetical protein n=1 Tax=Salmonella enterica TaxID=28901 RepID=UPI0019C76C89|nr:hypothetical protein [Salmonella enterica]WQG06091.1 hypothetical protein Q1J21_23705 [Salmonella enterica subsp. enterica serovar Abortusovis]WQG10655.1 hypothetical protein Q1J09_24080 [Salmonella enterica subsp. enterica serovar Abortusovis]WQG15058.1 hypothetical protein Q1I83_23220 [Salmonella enterica subsp. enterica serovar Abortusovis]HAK5294524.1 hypothetical protein [Salmonella enterica]HDN4695304.1 hypothetical protein [Salmonella enterica subsp. enterica serovar Abortusovis]
MMNKYMKKYDCLALLVCGGMVFQAGAVDSTQVTFNMSVPAPTCTMSVKNNASNTIVLGELVRGEINKSHSAFVIVADCNGMGGMGRNSLVATARTNAQQQLTSNNVQVAVKMGNNAIDTTHGPLLQLKNNNADVMLNGSKSFCTTSVAKMECSLTPVTSVYDGAPTGSGSAVVQFTMNYNA